MTEQLNKPKLKDGRRLDLADCFVGKAGEILDEGPANSGFAPRGAQVDVASPAFGFTVNRKLDCWVDNIAELYERAKSEQWDASQDIAWDKLPALREDVELATCQIMTFLIEAEFAALYVPAKFMALINPHYFEVPLFLATQVKDEARHIEVYRKRALANGLGLQRVAASVEWSLKALYSQEKFPEASFLLHVLGEGTFLTLLKFLEDTAPDPVTKEILKKTHQDEARHVGFGVSRTRYMIQHDKETAKNLLKAAEERANFLQAMTGTSPYIRDAFIVYAGGGTEPDQIEKGKALVKQLYRRMYEERISRLKLCGLDEQIAQKISELHGQQAPGFM